MTLVVGPKYYLDQGPKPLFVTHLSQPKDSCVRPTFDVLVIFGISDAI